MTFRSIFQRVFIQEESIAGLEISDNALRLVFLNEDKKKKSLFVEEYIEKKLDSGIIVNGIVSEPEKLCGALTEFKKMLKSGVHYLIVSIPFAEVYSRILPFSKNINDFELEEGIKLAIDFQMPYRSEDVFYTWEIFNEENSEKQNIFIAEIPKKIAEPYIECVQKIFNIVAIEFHSRSFSRIAAFKKDETILVKIPNETGTGFFVIKNNLINFSRTLNETGNEIIQKETEKIINFYESETDESISGVVNVSSDIPSFNIALDFPEIKTNPRWSISLGAALRGLIPREADASVSLLPISTQKAFQYQKAIGFASFLSRMSIALSVFFVASFAGIWLLMVTLQKNSLNRAISLNSQQFPVELAQAEERIQSLNTIISTTADIIKKAPNWSVLVDELEDKLPEGITINGLKFPSVNETLSITGVATDRPTLNLFRDQLKTTSMFADVTLPLANIDQKIDIPFTISFKIADPTFIYTQ